MWVSDITEHPTDTGRVYLAVVLDAFSRQVIGWSIADHLRSELVVDVLQMAIWRRNGPDGTIVHSDHGPLNLGNGGSSTFNAANRSIVPLRLESCGADESEHSGIAAVLEHGDELR